MPSPEPMPGRCGAKCKKDEWGNETGFCTQYPVRGARRCRMHSGAVDHKGVNNPNYQTGRWIESLPDRLVAQAQAALADPELISLRNEMATIEARVLDLLTSVDTGQTSGVFGDLRKSWRKFEASVRAKDKDMQNVALAEIRDLITYGASQHAAWSELGQQIDRLRKLKESEWKRLKDMGQMIQTERLLDIMAFVARSINENVSNRKERAAVQRDIRGRLLAVSGTGNQD